MKPKYIIGATLLSLVAFFSLYSLNDALLFFASLGPSVGGGIVFLTVALRFFLAPAQFIGMKSMKKMELIKPMMEKVKERYSKDPKRQGEELKKLFSKTSVNPMMGPIPMIIQIPIFIGLFNLLNDSNLVSGESFLPWINDLAIADPFYILPIIAAVLQFGVMWQSKAKFKLALTSVFTIMMVNMPAAILVYSISNSALTLIEKGIFNKLI